MYMYNVLDKQLAGCHVISRPMRSLCFLIVCSAEYRHKNLHLTQNILRKNINIKIFRTIFKCGSTTTEDLLIFAKMSEVNNIFNVILMLKVS